MEAHRNTWSPTVPTSIARARPPASTPIAASVSPIGMPRSLANKFIVPNGRIPRIRSDPSKCCAAQATVPSPPATTTISASSATAAASRSGSVPASGGMNSASRPAAANWSARVASACGLASSVPAAPLATTATRREAAGELEEIVGTVTAQLSIDA